MSEPKWTDEQKQAIDTRGNNILVAAGAGSGKTAVLVERIVKRVIEEKIDIDKILVVTFTNAAASEMRERVLEAIYKKLDIDYDNIHLQRQVLLLSKANISTIDSFCLDVIRNNFYKLDINPTFKIADTTETKILKLEALEEVFEKKYLENAKRFSKLIDTYASYRGDENLKEIVLKIFEFVQSSKDPEQFLNEKVEMFNIQDLNSDFKNTVWGNLLIETIQIEIEECIKELIKDRKTFEGYEDLITDYIAEFESISLKSWEDALDTINQVSFKRFSNKKDIDKNIGEKLKGKLEKIRADFDTIKILVQYNSKESNEDLLSMYDILLELKNIVFKFSLEFKKMKLEKNILDFNDIEHYALELFKDKEVTKMYREKFVEIMIDEYQDSNEVQETILTSISRGNNIFMVGDVKQSIYKFRQAMPELFLKKYKTYGITEAGKTIKLFKNFRSRSEVLNIVNIIFKTIMTEKIGDIDYTEEEFLNLGANYEESTNMLPELNIISVEDKAEEAVEDIEIEARFVACKIRELAKNNVQYKDIAILLRSTSNYSRIFEKAIKELGMPVFSDVTDSYLNSIEIETITSLLRIIDNPMQDIPLITVMRSPIANFTDDELVEIRLQNKTGLFYESLQVYDNEKVKQFLIMLEKFRNANEYMALGEFIWYIYLETGYLEYVEKMQDGNIRVENLKMLFERAKQYEKTSFKGLFNFIQFIEKLKQSSGDLGAARIISSEDNVVRIMSIHKSKGLEFPYVFVSGTGKNFNEQDQRQKILIHQNYGLGPEYIDCEKRISYSTNAKQALKQAIKREALGEEMRILYVALTRAREKLIITGINKKEEIKPISHAKSVLEWLRFVVENNNVNDLINVKYHNTTDVQKCFSEAVIKKDNVENNNLCEIVKEEKEKFEYKYQMATTIPTKMSVTKLKQKQQETTIIKPSPKFLNNKLELNNAEKRKCYALLFTKFRN